MLMSLLDHGETAIRLKPLEILEALTSYFVKECESQTIYEFAERGNQTQQPSGSSANPGNEMMVAEFISHERMQLNDLE